MVNIITGFCGGEAVPLNSIILLSVDTVLPSASVMAFPGQNAYVAPPKVLNPNRLPKSLHPKPYFNHDIELWTPVVQNKAV